MKFNDYLEKEIIKTKKRNEKQRKIWAKRDRKWKKLGIKFNELDVQARRNHVIFMEVVKKNCKCDWHIDWANGITHRPIV